MNVFVRNNIFLLVISLALFITPFFWLPQGTMDLGGDATRLYFYDPTSFLEQQMTSYVSLGYGEILPRYYLIPYVIPIHRFLSLFQSTWLTISFFTGLKITGAFLSIYGIVYALSNCVVTNTRLRQFAALLSSMFYITFPNTALNWPKALVSHDQLLVNPLMFYLMYQLFSTGNLRYVLYILATMIVFSPSFSMTSAPPFFAFYPIAGVFLFLLLRMTNQLKLSWKKSAAIFLLLIGVQMYQVLPQAHNLLSPDSLFNDRIFDEKNIAREGVEYFMSVLQYAHASEGFLPEIIGSIPHIRNSIPMVIIIVALLLQTTKNRKLLLLTTGVFLLTLFLLKARITDVGVEIYTILFYLPGFSMFRNFIGQWAYVYSFFYALLFGLAVSIVFEKIKNIRLIYFSVAILFISIVITGWSILNGSIVRAVHSGSENVPVYFSMDPQFDTFIEHVSVLPDDYKILTLPLTDSFYQVLYGKEEGAYIGPPLISHLTDKHDFSGYQHFEPHGELLMQLSREKRYEEIKNFIKIMGIGYVYHNSDPRIFEERFPQSPYTYMHTSFPVSQAEYQEFIQQLDGELLYASGTHVLYRIGNPLPFVYRMSDLHIELSMSEILLDSLPIAPASLDYQQISPTEISVQIIPHEQDESNISYIVLNTKFSNDWELMPEDHSIHVVRHLRVFGFANAWEVDYSGHDAQPIRMKIRLKTEDYYHTGLKISMLSVLLLIGWIAYTAIIRKSQL